jgi:hypothetical protein
MDKVSLKLVVAGRTYPLTVNKGEQDKVEKAASDINNAIQLLKENYAVKDMQDLLAMAALQIATKSKPGESSPNSTLDTESIEKSLDTVLEELKGLH